MLRSTTRNIANPRILGVRFASAGPGGSNQNSVDTLPRRPMKKIKLGKARPAIYHQFNCKTELSDGSVVIRRSQYPKEELRMIQDQRNHPLWNPFREDLVVVDANAGGKMARFKQRYSQFAVEEDIKEDIEKRQAAEGKAPASEESKEENENDVDAMMMDEYLELLGQNVQEVQKGGKLSTKASRARKK